MHCAYGHRYVYLYSVIPWFIQAYYLLLDFPQYNAMELMKLSFRIMKGHKWELFCLQMSFLPLGFLCLLSFGIGSLWLVPYMNMTQTLYFLD